MPETASIERVLLTLAVSFALAILLGAPGLVHAGQGMPDGPMRSVTLSVGRVILNVTGSAHLTAPWDGLESALGHRTQPAGAPMLASSSAVPPATPVAVSAVTNGHAAGSHVLSPRRAMPHGLRRPTARNPLRLLVTGDSLTEFLGPILVDDAARTGVVRGLTDTHYGTGLVRPDFVDWSVVARQQVVADNPEAVVVLMGGNDFQNMVVNGQILLAATPAWTREYARRAAICMRIWSQNGTRRVYWLSIPPARGAAWSYADAQMDLAIQRAASQVPGARYLDIRGPITNHGQYADFVTVNGQPTLVRTQDGVHLTDAGAAIVASEVMRVLARDWHLPG